MIKLNSLEMAEFAARGVIRFDGVVPDAINQRFLQAMTSIDGESPRQHYQRLMEQQAMPLVDPGTTLEDAYAKTSPIGELLQIPKVAGAIVSLVGPQCVVDHHFLHITFPGGSPQHTHQDSTIDPRRAFDAQLFYFPHEVTAEMGGTRFIPGSHLRIVSEASIGRYQNIVGQEQVVCPAGSVFFFHHGLWHGGGANHSRYKRYLLKIRLCPTQRQTRLWNTQDLPETHAHQHPIFWTDPSYVRDPIHEVLTTPEPWFEFDTGRLEYLNRIRFWRYLLGDDSFDADYWLTRVENEYV